MEFLAMDVIEINNQTYAYNIHQRDSTLSTLLMQHGFMGDHRVFDHLIESLCKFCNPISIDLLGYGQSSKPTDPQRYRERRQIEDLLSLIKNLNLRQPFLYGYSMGGRLAMQMALAKPKQFTGVILESAHCGIADESARKERRQKDQKRAQRITSDFDKFLADWATLDLFKSPLPVDTELAQKYHKIQSEQSPAALAASLKGFGAGSMTPICNELHKLEIPTLLIAGSEDAKYQQVNNHMTNRLPNAIFTSIEAGHRVHLDNPPAFLNKLKNFTQDS